MEEVELLGTCIIIPQLQQGLKNAKKKIVKKVREMIRRNKKYTRKKTLHPLIISYNSNINMY